MLQKVFKVVLHEIPSTLALSHPLHVGLHETFVKSCLKKDTLLTEDGNFIGAIMREYPTIFVDIECIFVQTCIVEAPLPTNDGEICLYITKQFLRHYNYNYGDVCYFKRVACHNLSKVIMGTKTHESFTWFQDSKAQKDLMTHCSLIKPLCRYNDVLLTDPSNKSKEKLLYQNYITLDCQPLRQGLISLSTSIIVADISDSSSQKPRSTKSSTDNVDAISFGKYAMNLINYTSSNFLGIRLPRSISSSYTSWAALKFMFSFEIRVMSKLNPHFIKELMMIEKDIDPLNTVFLSFTLRKKLNLINGSWIKISLSELVKTKVSSPIEPFSKPIHEKSSNAENQTTSRVAQVCCFSDEKVSSLYFTNDKVAYISPHLWFNLNKHPSVLMQPDLRLQIEPLDGEFSPPFAKEAHATIIHSPNYNSKINSQDMITKYFQNFRYICKGDIFTTDSKDQIDFHLKADFHNKLKWPVIHFRITMLEGPETSTGYIISNSQTLFYQVGIKQCYVPVTMETYYSSTPEHPIWNAVPEGLSHYIYLLQDLIFPFLKLQNEQCRLSSNIVFYGPPCCGKTIVVKAVCRCLNLHLYQINCHEFVGDTPAVFEARLKNRVEKGITYAPCVILLKNIHLIGKEKGPSSDDSRVIHSLANTLKNVNIYGSEWPVVVIATSHEVSLNNDLLTAFLHTVKMKAPTEEERLYILQDLLSVCDVSSDVSPLYLAQRTAGFVLGDLCALMNESVRNAYSRIRTYADQNVLSLQEEEDIVLASVPIVQRDMIKALETLQSKFAEAIGAPKIPDVKFEDVGGLAEVKQEILDTIQLPLEHPEILFSGLRRSGVLLYGPPGSGKTLLAKAVATECSLNFLSVKGPELINMYVGQSEENVRAVFHQARSAVPCIIFFDELDSLAPNRGRSGDSGGVMDRVVSQLLSELDGLNKKSEVFVIGATNRPDLIDPALLRPGRFDRLLYVGIPEDKRAKLNILKALTRKMPLAETVNLEEIIEKCPENLSGADFYSLCSNAVIQRVEKNVDLVEKGEKKIEELDPGIQTEDFLHAMATLVPSVSTDQFKQYKVIKSKIETD